MTTNSTPSICTRCEGSGDMGTVGDGDEFEEYMECAVCDGTGVIQNLESGRPNPSLDDTTNSGSGGGHDGE